MQRAIRALVFAVFLTGLTAIETGAQTDPLKDCSGPRTAPDAVIAACTKVTARSELDPFVRAQAYGHRALARRDKNQIEEAIADFGRAIELSPHHMFYFNRGETYRRSARVEQAKADFRKVLERDPGNNAARDMLRQLGEQVPPSGGGGGGCSGPLCTMF